MPKSFFFGSIFKQFLEMQTIDENVSLSKKKKSLLLTVDQLELK